MVLTDQGKEWISVVVQPVGGGQEDLKLWSILSGLPAARLIRIELTGRCSEKLQD